VDYRGEFLRSEWRNVCFKLIELEASYVAQDKKSEIKVLKSVLEFNKKFHLGLHLMLPFFYLS